MTIGPRQVKLEGLGELMEGWGGGPFPAQITCYSLQERAPKTRTRYSDYLSRDADKAEFYEESA